MKSIFRFIVVFFIALLLWFSLIVFTPAEFGQKSTIVFEVEKGWGYKDIARALSKKEIIKHPVFFNAYVLVSGSFGRLQAGKYELSKSMSIAEITTAMSTGQVIKNRVTVIEGWTLEDITDYFDRNNVYPKADFTKAVSNDFSDTFSFLKDQPSRSTLEGYLFPDTYEIGKGQTADQTVKAMLANFDKKLNPELREEIARQKKSVFQIVTMASMLEREVITQEDKKVVAGILWKRLAEGVPLQVDATLLYITGKNKVDVGDKTIDSRYNTYKYYGLPQGPICNPGIDSIVAAIYPEKTDYWYYLSAKDDGTTIFSKTLEEHNAAVAKHLKS